MWIPRLGVRWTTGLGNYESWKILKKKILKKMKFCKNQKNFNSIHVPVYIKRRSSSTQKILMLLSTSPPNICITVVLANTSIKKRVFSHFRIEHYQREKYITYRFANVSQPWLGERKFAICRQGNWGDFFEWKILLFMQKNENSKKFWIFFSHFHQIYRLHFKRRNSL